MNGEEEPLKASTSSRFATGSSRSSRDRMSSKSPSSRRDRPSGRYKSPDIDTVSAKSPMAEEEIPSAAVAGTRANRRLRHHQDADPQPAVQEELPRRQIRHYQDAVTTEAEAVEEEAPHRRVRHHQGKVPGEEDGDMGVPSLDLGVSDEETQASRKDLSLGIPKASPSAKSPSVRTPAGSSSKKLPPSSTKSGRFSSKAAAAASPIGMNEAEATETDDPDMLQMKRLRETYSYFQRIQEDMKLDDDNDGHSEMGEDSVRVSVKPNQVEEKPGAAWRALGSMATARAFSSSAEGRRSLADTALVANTGITRREQLAPDGGERMFGGADSSSVRAVSSRTPSTPEVPLNEEDAALDDYFAKVELKFPEAPALEEFVPPEPPTYEEEYAEESKDRKVVLGKIPKEKVREQKDILKTKLYEERSKAMEAIKAKERDVMWREHLASKRVKELEDAAREKAAVERIKSANTRLDREKKLAREFRRARESLESCVQRQGALLGEVFGELDQHSQMSMARKMFVKSVQLPQPVEVRVHLMRAVKNKLPKGAYCIMLTQYDSLGGHALAWSKLGSHSIGDEFPATTRAVKHHGRYFDKTMKFEDSCFALCPPTKDRKPGYVFVLELFELKGKACAEDRVVAWTALPMCNEGLMVVEGKIKLPMLRGRHSPSDTLFKQMEERVAQDLEAWLCNIYVEVRPFGLAELGPVAQDIVKLDRFVNLDFLNKRLDMQNGKGAYSKIFGFFGDQRERRKEVEQRVIAEKGFLDDKLVEVYMRQTSEFDQVQVELDEGLLRLSEARTDSLKSRRKSRIEDALAARGIDYDAGVDESQAMERLVESRADIDQNRRNFQDGFGTFSRKVREVENQSIVNSTIIRAQKWWYEHVMGKPLVESQSGKFVTQSQKPRWQPHKHYDSSVRAKLMQTTKKFDKAAAETGHQARIIDERSHSDQLDLSLRVSSAARKKPGSPDNEVDMREQLFDSPRTDVEAPAAAGAGDGDNETKDGSEKTAVDSSSKKSVGGAVLDAMGVGQEQQAGFALEELVQDGLDMDGFSTDEEEGDGASAQPLSESSRDPPRDVVEEDRLAREQERLKDLSKKRKNEEDEVVLQEVLDRGLDGASLVGAKGAGVINDLDLEQSGKLVGIESVDGEDNRYFASSGLNRRITRRLQADGPRLDTEGIPNPNNPAGKNEWIDRLQPSVAFNKTEAGWTALEDPRDFDLYSMAVNSQTAAAKLTSNGIVASKLRFLAGEAFGDLTRHKFGSFDFYVTIFVLIFTLWLRIWLHYLGEYMYLSALGTPIYDFAYDVAQIQFKYMSNSLEFGSEVWLIFMGPLFVGICFCCFAELARSFHTFASMIPDGVSKFVSCFGVNMVFGPYITLVADLCYQNYDCENRSTACQKDYTSSDCDCFTGDFAKLWERSVSDEGSGISGLLITIIVYMTFTAFSGVLFYEYLVYYHRNGRIIDLWRRITCNEGEFYIPDDFEISLTELKLVCQKAAHWTGGQGEKRKLSVTVHEERDAEDPNFLHETKLFSLHEISFDGNKRKVWRQFLVLPDGTITEVFDKVGFGEYQAETAVPSPDTNFTAPTAVKRTKTGLFKGLERA